MSRSTTPYADNETNKILKRLHNKLRPAGTPIERVEYIIELLLLRVFETKLRQDESFKPLRNLFDGENHRLLFSYLLNINGEQILSHLNNVIFPFYGSILTKARPAIKGNLTPNMQDSLVLMEEVFANSNFTNNVQGGVLSEIIGMVSEINEERILKTDLLGDAIESALSETGGAKDFGLYRTPDHIRQMMVKMVDPDFVDTIFDPACGTAGFLFDAYDYISEKALKNEEMPNQAVAAMFHRSGVGGIEYQGRIRKMAAVNMYIRGLNPHNIQQGDSLKMYAPDIDENTKSVILANPPFGAERDQPAYANVWEEYSKESETTILFVKLMFDHLKNGGRCAVVVSEGFLTWGHNSACALRKILLNEANLKAIISLPQGVFVSKSGQGAKTSVLYFEKGKSTNFVWYYKIENDGFSKGTNRKPIEGGQIPEMLNFFEQVKCGQKPPDTQYSFCVDKKPIETLDPRIIEETKKIVGEKTKQAFIKKHAKALDNLKKEFANKRINKAMHESKLKHFDSLMEIQINSEIAKVIEKKHTYDFNLQNYRSGLNPEQIKEWQKIMLTVEINNKQTLIDKYRTLQSTDPITALHILASLAPQDAIQMDIAREYLNNLDGNILLNNEKLKKVEEILIKGNAYSLTELGKVITPEYEKIKREDFQGDFDVVKKISFADGVVHFRSERETGMDLYKAKEGHLITSKINVHQGAVALSPYELVASTHYQVYSINESLIIPKYLVLVLRSPDFLEKIELEKAGGIKNESGAEFLSGLEIPLPLVDVQEGIVAEIDGYQKVIDGAKQVIANWKPQIKINTKWTTVQIGDVCEIGSSKRVFQSEWKKEGVPFYRAREIVKLAKDGFVDNELFISQEMFDEYSQKYGFPKEGDLMVTGIGTLGIAYRVNSKDEFYFKDGNIIWFKEFKENTNSKFIKLLFDTDIIQNQIKQLPVGGVVGTYTITNAKETKIPLPSLEIQEQIIAEIESEQQIITANKTLIAKMEQKISDKISELWGE